MATLYDFLCTNCDYSSSMAGEPSMLMYGYTIPVVCEKCKEISDEIQLFTANEKVEIEPKWKCQECHAKKYYFWDFNKKPCPKCVVGTLVIDQDGIVIDAD